MAKRDFHTRLNAEGIHCAEGYIFALEKKGYISAGSFTPQIILERPELAEELHRDFQFAGSDVMLTLTYYAHREKLRVIGLENKLVELNKTAIKIAKKVAKDTPSVNGVPTEENLVAGNICNTNIWSSTDETVQKKVRAIFDEQLDIIQEEGGIDYVIGETFNTYGESLSALKSIKAKNLPAVINLSLIDKDKTVDGIEYTEALHRLKQEGADVVGYNCHTGPFTLLPYLEKLRAKVQGHISAVPVPYRTGQHLSFFYLDDDEAIVKPPHGKSFPTSLDRFLSNRYEIREFTKRAYHDIGVRYLGLCCGNNPVLTREVSLIMGKPTPGGEFLDNMTQHVYYGDKDHSTLKVQNSDHSHDHNHDGSCNHNH